MAGRIPQGVRENAVNVVIVGAGIAGLAAARKLLTSAPETFRVTLLEAQARVGGRIHTQEYGSSYIEVGAQWIHGQKGNVVYNLAHAHGLLKQRTKAEAIISRAVTIISNILSWFKSNKDYSNDDAWSGEDDDCFMTENGDRIPQGLVTEVFKDFDVMIDNLTKRVRADKAGVPEGRSMLHDISEWIDKYLAEHRETDSEKTLTLRSGLVHWSNNLQHIDNACGSMSRVSVHSYGEYIECGGNQLTELENGFQPILDILLQDIPSGVIRTSMPVTDIHWTADNQSQDENKVNVTVKNGEDITHFKADHLIYTASIGCLREDSAIMFQPPLPADKQQAAKTMGFGMVNKIFLEFQTPFWSKYDFGFQLVWINRHERNMDEISKWWHKDIIGFDALENQPNMLEGWIAGEAAAYIEGLSEEVIGDACVQLLKRFTKKDVPKPKNVLRSQWMSNKYTRGSYTNLFVESKVEDIVVLAQPLPNIQDPVVMFAGEATHPAHFSTVHGAMESGEREAVRLLRKYGCSGLETCGDLAKDIATTAEETNQGIMYYNFPHKAYNEL